MPNITAPPSPASFHCYCNSWVEQDPLAIWDSVQQAVQQAMEEALEQYGALSVVAVGITNQRERQCCSVTAACNGQRCSG